MVTGRTFSTSSIQREVSQAQGHAGSNQKSTVVVSATGGAGNGSGPAGSGAVAATLASALTTLAFTFATLSAFVLPLLLTHWSSLGGPIDDVAKGL